MQQNELTPLQKFLKDLEYNDNASEKKINNILYQAGKSIELITKLQPYFNRLIELVPFHEPPTMFGMVRVTIKEMANKQPGEAVKQLLHFIMGSYIVELWLVLDALDLHDFRKEIWTTNEPYDLHPLKDKFVEEVKNRLQLPSRSAIGLSTKFNEAEEITKLKKMLREKDDKIKELMEENEELKALVQVDKIHIRALDDIIKDLSTPISSDAEKELNAKNKL